MPVLVFAPIDAPGSLLGESPFWHPVERALYWVDIAGCTLHRHAPGTGMHHQWAMPSEIACIAPCTDGGLVCGMRDGIHRLDLRTGARTLLACPPYDPASRRFNDGKADPRGRFWLGTLDDARRPSGALYRLSAQGLERVVGDVTASNSLAWSADGKTMYWADTRTHVVNAFDFEPCTGSVSGRRVFARFDPLPAEGALEHYAGRPDGAAVDVEGCVWIAGYEGQRLFRFGPDGSLRASVTLPVRCPTMPCFGGDDLCTLYVTTARHRRPAAELAQLPWSGRVLQCRVDVPGLPVNFAAVESLPRQHAGYEAAARHVPR